MKKATISVPASVLAVLALGAPVHGSVFAHTSSAPTSVIALLDAGRSTIGFAFNDADSVITAHRERQGQLMDSSQAILNRAEGETRDLTEAEQSEVEALTREFDDLERQISLREIVNRQNERLSAPRGRQTDPDSIEGEDPPTAAQREARPHAAARGDRSGQRVPAEPRVSARGTAGFRHLGDFANSVRMATLRQGGEMDARLRNAAATTYSSEAIGADGGFAVPPDFRADIMARVYNEDSLITRTDRQFSSSNTMTFPVDETTPWQTTGGIQAYWAGEAAAMAQSKPALGSNTIKLEKLTALVPITEEQLEDAPGMDSYLRKKAPEKIDFKLSYAIAWGNGAGMPLGFMNAGSLVTQAAEGAQTADTIVTANVVKMLGRLPTASRRSAVWLIHPDAEVQLPLMTIGQQPAYVAPGGFKDNPFGSLLGRQVIPHQVCETVGDLGDIMLVDLNEYLTATRLGGGRDANGLKVDTSMHLWFDQDLMAFKFTLRVAGQPWFSAPITQRDGANTQSAFVTLAAR